MKKNLFIGIGSLAVLLAGGSAYYMTRPKDTIKWRTTQVEKGNITQLISSTGTMNAVVQVAVGTQVSGVIKALYADYNSLVKKGQLIAQIDPTMKDIQLAEAQATLDRSSTNVMDAKRQLERAKRMSVDKLISQQDLEAKEVAYATAINTQKIARASMEKARADRRYCDITAPVDGVVISRLADVGQTVAASFSTPNLFQIAQDLSKMKVEISIDEADIDEIKVGQKAQFTVDSLQDRQFEAIVNQVRLEPITNSNVVTYKVVIVVDNEPLDRPRRHRGEGDGDEGKSLDEVWEQRKERILERNPEMTKEQWIKRRKERESERATESTPTPAPVIPLKGLSREQAARTPGGIAFLGGPTFSGNLALRPGMTANVSIHTNSRDNVLKVPNAALRFNPKMFLKEDNKKKMDLGQAMMGGSPGGPGGRRNRPGGAQVKTPKKGIVAKREDRIWVLENGAPKPIRVRTGISDGQFTEIMGEGVKEDMEILLGVESGGKNGGGSGSSGSSGRPGGGPH